ncbi:sensor histidine kinase [Streptomyces sp. NPDC096132]|uniref:ATP-binding protein n=1 Tax=Streptomyces sp. NPDC096132 TaxID=3366075 RepID=UPI0038223669
MPETETIRDWSLPALLAAAQLAWLWAYGPWRDGDLPGAVATVAVGCALAVETAALGWRRRTPVRSLAGSVGALAVGLVAWEDGYFALGSLVSLYSVAVRCPLPVTLRAVAAVIGAEWLLAFAMAGLRTAPLAEWAVAALVYVLCAGLGEARRQWRARRLTAARRLAGAEESRRRAGENERHRLARELHDVSAHHLTSVVVTVDAAGRLGGTRPEPAAEALEFAERTGLETQASLRRLVGLMREPEPREAESMTGRIQELVAGFGRLGRPIATELPPDLTGPVGEAVHGIVREALTNAIRYAPGAAVRVAVVRDEGRLLLTVTNGPSGTRAPHAAGGLGSGHGIAGMRQRAAAVGGELSTGATADGGWRVEAALPDTLTPRAPEGWRRDVLQEQLLVDPALAFTAAVLPVFFLLIGAEDWSRQTRHAAIPGLVLVSALFALHALPLVWRRRAPRAALAGVLASSSLWPAAIALAPVSPRLSPYFAVGLIAECLAVYALGAYGHSAARTWPWVLAAGTVSTCALVATAAADGELTGGGPFWVMVAVLVVPLSILSCAGFVLLWGVGLMVRRHRLRVLARDDFALAGSAWQAVQSAGAERHLLATRLSDAVLRHTAHLVELARAGRLDDVAAEARAALAAMRELLHSLDEPAEPGVAPPPTATDLEALCESLRSAGRQVVLRGLPKTAAGMGPAVTRSVYGIVETALGAGDRDRARIRLHRRRDTLHLTISGVRLAVVGPVAERLKAQVTADEGRLALEPAGTVRVSLPLASAPSPLPRGADGVRSPSGWEGVRPPEH